jgi:ferredoxin-NADP reductase
LANPQKLKAEVTDIVSYGRQVYKLVFKTEKKIPRFKAGQFLHLTLDDFDPTTGFWPESRVFSIASCSDDREEVAIVYSVKGVYTKRMEDTLSVGASVWLKAPYGEFIISNYIQDDQTAVLIAGGTGVSPFIPFLKQSGIFPKIQLNYGLRNKDLIIFEEDLAVVLNQDNFFMNLYLEEMSDKVPISGNLAVMEGLLSVNSILEGIQDKDNSVFFLSGPPEMIELFQQQLIQSGIEKEKIVIDEWG